MSKSNRLTQAQNDAGSLLPDTGAHTDSSESGERRDVPGYNQVVQDAGLGIYRVLSAEHPDYRVNAVSPDAAAEYVARDLLEPTTGSDARRNAYADATSFAVYDPENAAVHQYDAAVWDGDTDQAGPDWMPQNIAEAQDTAVAVTRLPDRLYDPQRDAPDWLPGTITEAHDPDPVFD